MYHRKVESDYFQHDDDGIQQVTGSQILRAYGVPPIQEAQSFEEFTMRHIEVSHISNPAARSEFRNHSLGGTSHILSNTAKPHYLVNSEFNSVILPNAAQARSHNQQATSIIVSPQNPNGQQPLLTSSSKPLGGSSMASADINFPLQQSYHTKKHESNNINTAGGVDSFENMGRIQDSLAITIQQKHFATVATSAGNHKDVSPKNSSPRSQFQQNSTGSYLLTPHTATTTTTTTTTTTGNHIQSPQSQENTTCIIGSSEPVAILCPYCSKSVTTVLTFQPTTKTHLIAAALCVFGFACALCLAPYYWKNKFQVTIHTCPACAMEIGRHTP